MSDSDRGRLMGWKAIGNFVGRDARTARRWETERGLPVHRLPGGGSASVWADRDELAGWMASEGKPQRTTEVAPPPPASSRRAGWFLAASLAAIVAITSFLVMERTIRSKATAGSAAGSVTAAADAPYGADARANGMYRAASYAMNTRSVAGLADAARQFGVLTNAHPNNAAAFVGLAETNLLLREFDSLPDETAYRRAGFAAQRALEIDPNSAGALRSLAFVRYWSDGARSEAFGLFRRAIARDPTDAQSHHWYGTALLGEGRFKEALAALDKAHTLNPGSSAIVTDEAYVRYLAGQHAAAIASLKSITEIDPSFSGAHTYLATIYLVERNDAGFLSESAISARLKHDALRARTTELARSAFRSGGRPAMLAALTASAEQAFQQTGGRAITIAQMNALSGNRGEALRWLARAESIREPEIRSIRAYPAFGPYWNDPDFKRYFVAS